MCRLSSGVTRAATEGVTPLFFPEKTGDLFSRHFCGVTPGFFSKTNDLFCSSLSPSLSLFIAFTRVSPPRGCHLTPFLPARPRFSTILCKFAHNFFPSGVTLVEGVTPRTPLVTPLRLRSVLSTLSQTEQLKGGSPVCIKPNMFTLVNDLSAAQFVTINVDGTGFIISCPVSQPDCLALFYFVINACISRVIITLIRYFLIPKSRDLIAHKLRDFGIKKRSGIPVTIKDPGSQDCNVQPLYITLRMTTRLNNNIIMVHLIRSLLTNLYSMIAIEAKYVELAL